ncbi:MAG TPA: alpha/beta fold hydrolase [Balneolaceae bacterium]|nr:alpha/beta fold hydrolase [Balneolaceae bacterium]
MKTSSVQKQTNQIPSTEGLPIRYDIYSPEGVQSPLPVILFLHGFKGFKDWGTFPEICKQIATKGFAVIAMNFSLNGIGENKMEFDRLDLFSRETLSQDLEDVGTVIKAIKSKAIEIGETSKIGILGHSRGGQTAAAAAAEYADIDCLVTWSAVADYNARWSEKMLHDWQTKGVTEIKNGRTGQIMPMKKMVHEDALRNAERVIALNRVDELEIPALFVHGEEDEAVNPKNAEQLYNACSSQEKDLLLVSDAGHTYGGSHPFQSDELPKPLNRALAKTTQWFEAYLK